MMNIPFAKVDCTGNEKHYVDQVLSNGWLTTGPKAQMLENQFADYLGCKHALVVNSCTSALHLALEALNVKPGDRVFVPSLTFTASAEIVRYLGADPLLLDVDYMTGALNASILENAIARHPDVKTLVAVHYGGQALPMTTDDQRGIQDICRLHGVRIVEDAAHALPSRWNGQLVGSFSDLTCFSFYANKTMTTGEGGMVTTNSDEYAQRIKLMRLHGINRVAWDRFTKGSASWEYDVVAPGFKYNMPDLNAVVGLAQLERLEEMRERRQRCAEIYNERLADCEWLELPVCIGPRTDHSWHLYPVRVTRQSGLDRSQLIEELSAKGIGTSVHYKPLHRLTYYRDKYQLKANDYPNAESIWQRCLSLPIYNTLTDAETHYICDCIELIGKSLADSKAYEDESYVLLENAAG